MAQLTYDPTPADQPEFNEAEQEALAIGEQAQQDQQRMYADKFKDAEALEQAYIELQKKLGTNNEDAEEGVRDEAPTEEVEEPNKAVELINEASQYWAEKGELTDEMRQAFSELSSDELIDAYMSTQGQQPQRDLNDNEIQAIKSVAGGDEAYEQLTAWAGSNLETDVIEAFDNLVEQGSARMVQLAVAGLKAEYEKSNGFEGEMLTGRAARQVQDTFRSQAEVVAAMQDPRYDRDPAYRQDVFQKLERSDINYQ
tara:strand:+ start:951 stop:1715 length:765 start_codon:yes stop_codon:yes gene_type:complete